MRVTARALILALTCISPATLTVAKPPAAAAPSEHESSTPVAAPQGDCEVGLVLSGGGARGIAHVGVLRALEEHGIRIDCITGASMGAVIGALYAVGLPIDEIERLLASMSLHNMYSDPHDRNLFPISHREEGIASALRLGINQGGLRLPRAMLSDYLVNRTLIEHLAPANFEAGRDFARLPIPFATVGTDIRTAERVVLDSGDLGRAVRSSMSVPLAYSPVAIGEHLLVDGGLVDNLPVGVAQRLGARYTIAVDVSTPLDPTRTFDLLGMGAQIIDLLYAARNSVYRREPDVWIAPQLGGHSFANYGGVDELIAKGYEAAIAAIPGIPDRYRGASTPTPAQADDSAGLPLQGREIGAIRIHGNSFVSDGLVRRELGLWPGNTFDLERALHAMDHLYSTGLFDSVWLDFVPEGDDRVEIWARVDETYRTSLDLALAYDDDDQVQGLAELSARDVLGVGERLYVRAMTSERELVFRVGLDGDRILGTHFGFRARAEINRERPKVYVGNKYLNRAEFNRRVAGFDALMPINTSSRVSAGVVLGEVEIGERLGVSELPGFALDKHQQRVLSVGYLWDDLDSIVLPRSGKRLALEVMRNVESLGATTDYWRASMRAEAAVPLGGRLTAEIHALYGYSHGELPVYDQFRIGGPTLIPGFHREALWGNHAIAASLGLGFALAPIVRLTPRIGAGNVWADFADVDVADVMIGGGLTVKIATPVGPIRADYGINEEEDRVFTIALGFPLGRRY